MQIGRDDGQRDFKRGKIIRYFLGQKLRAAVLARAQREEADAGFLRENGAIRGVGAGEVDLERLDRMLARVAVVPVASLSL